MGLGQADVVECLSRGDRDLERPRVGVPDVLRRGDDQSPGDEPRVLAGRDHRRQPVQRSVRVVAADALDERGDGVVVAVARAVVGEDPLLGGGLDIREAWGETRPSCDVLRLGERDRALEDVEGLPRVATGDLHEMLERVVGEGDAAVRPQRARQPAVRVLERAPDDHADVLVGERLEPPHAHRDRSAEFTSKYGFSVVAPMSVTVPSSTCGSSASCCALLKR